MYNSLGGIGSLERTPKQAELRNFFVYLTGTPLLKHGIHCIAVEYNESDVSDSVDVAIVMHHQMPPVEPSIREDEGEMP